jgi:hypothetical protein
MENRLKELQHGLAMDRTSCHRFLANQFRVLLTAAAYILFQALQAHTPGTACADAQVSTLRERLLKLAVWIKGSARRIVLQLPRTYPWLTAWRQIARAVGAVPASARPSVGSTPEAWKTHRSAPPWNPWHERGPALCRSRCSDPSPPDHSEDAPLRSTRQRGPCTSGKTPVHA